MTGGGGFSWKTNRYGLTSDTMLQGELVLPNGTLAVVSDSINPDLFWAIRGGGNRFGVLYNIRLRAVPQEPIVYGGAKIYSGDEIPALLDATYDFAATNQDVSLQILPTTNYLLGQPLAILIALCDRDPGNTT